MPTPVSVARMRKRGLILMTGEQFLRTSMSNSQSIQIGTYKRITSYSATNLTSRTQAELEDLSRVSRLFPMLTQKSARSTLTTSPPLPSAPHPAESLWDLGLRSISRRPSQVTRGKNLISKTVSHFSCTISMIAYSETPIFPQQLTSGLHQRRDKVSRNWQFSTLRKRSNSVVC